MIRGLFSENEQKIVHSLVAGTVVFLTPANLDSIIMDCERLNTAWELANMYLLSMSVEPLSPNAPQILGKNEDQKCVISQQYFDETRPFVDYVVHEVAHLFHNCRRQTIGLPETRRQKC